MKGTPRERLLPRGLPCCIRWPREASRVGAAFWLERKLDPARAAFETVASIAPGSVSTWTRLARTYRALDLRLERELELRD